MNKMTNCMFNERDFEWLIIFNSLNLVKGVALAEVDPGSLQHLRGISL